MLCESAGCFVSVKFLGVYCIGEYAVRVSGVFYDSEISGCVSGVLCIYRVLLLSLFKGIMGVFFLEIYLAE